MRIFLRKTSLVDFPGRVSSVFFFSGCNLRCPWCHNRELVLGGAEGFAAPGEALAHLEKRRSVLGGVVLSGGEPCLWNGLPGLIREIKKLNLPVKLDTNGMFPAMLEKLFGREETRPDYIALDLKTAPNRYADLLAPEHRAELLPKSGVFRGANNRVFEETGRVIAPNAAGRLPKETDRVIAPNAPGAALSQSAALIRCSGIPHEYRTIVLPRAPAPESAADKKEEGDGFITEKDIEALAPLAEDAPWYFRPFRGGNCLDPAWNTAEESAAAAKTRAGALAKKAKELGRNAIIL